MDRKKFCWNICKDNMLLIYGLLQVILLAMLRKYYLLTVYQTVAAYLFVCLCGVIVLKFVRNKAVQNISFDVEFLSWDYYTWIPDTGNVLSYINADQ